MERVSLVEYFDKMGFGRYTAQINETVFAKRCGVATSTICRMLKGDYDFSKSKAASKVAKVLKEDGYELVSNSLSERLQRANEYIALLEEQNKELTKMLEETLKEGE